MNGTAKTKGLGLSFAVGPSKSKGFDQMQKKKRTLEKNAPNNRFFANNIT